MLFSGLCAKFVSKDRNRHIGGGKVSGMPIKPHDYFSVAVSQVKN
jgi:hypothetical protein